jgi:phthiocerol/phenolphthiocerol synthesis type-I polyketide synthase D
MSRSADELRSWLLPRIAELLEVPVSQVDPNRPLTDLGLSSTDAMSLLGEAEVHLGHPVDPTIIWEAGTAAALATALAAGTGTTGTSGDGSGPEAAGSSPRLDAAPARAPRRHVAAQEEPIAVVGVGCRLPGGVRGPEAYWQFLSAGTDGIGEVPQGRWDQFPAPSPASAAAVAATPRFGGFLDDIASFDAEHFGITPTEAAVMDPQQRMMLEVGWEALAHAGIAPESLAGSATGVWVGMSGNEYSHLTMSDLSRTDAWAATGSALSITANRLSYLLDLRGPSMTLDTACSSSLVATHEAVGSLRSGEVDLALVGGVNLLLAPSVTVAFHRAQSLASDGRCKPFGADADGMVRSEAVAVVVLKRLNRAVADGDRVLAVIRGSGVNSDGRSNGMVAPNPAAQADLMRSVYAGIGLDPAEVDYVEAHGTGTLLGDPVEARALGEVFAPGRGPRSPLLIGSVKSNLGHSEAAAGVVSLVKVVLSLHHGMLPPSLHANRGNPHIPFRDWRLEVVRRLRPWPRRGERARAGVSAFGFGGTNAHLVVEEWDPDARQLTAPAEPALPQREEYVGTVVVTGSGPERIRETAAALADHLDAAPSTDLMDLSHTLARRWSAGPRRAVVAGRGVAGVTAGLRALAADQQFPGVVPVPSPGTGAGTDRGAVWVFSGYGSAWPGMGARLLEDEPDFRRAVEEIALALKETGGTDLIGLLTSGGGDLGVEETQVALFGMHVALARTWQSYGHRPSAVIGHSLGEVAAAVVSGALSLRDGALVASTRARLLARMERLGGGAMAVVDLTEDELAAVSETFPGVAVAVHASPGQLTIGGPVEQVLGLVEQVEALGRNAWVLPVSGAGHSAAVDPVLDELTGALSGIRPGPADVPVYGTVLDDPRTPPMFDAGYWRANLRRPVRFAQAVAAAVQDGSDVFVEMSAHPVAARAVRATLTALGSEGVVLPTLLRDADDTVAFRGHLAALALTPGYRAAGPARVGGTGDRDGGPDVFDGAGIPRGGHADLPMPTWRRMHHWASGPPAPAGHGPHPLLSDFVELPEDGTLVSRVRLDLDAVPWLTDHRVRDVVVFPAAAVTELALVAAGAGLGSPTDPVPAADLLVRDVELHRMLSIPANVEATVTVRVTRDGTARVDLHARGPAQATSRRFATATVHRAGSEPGRDEAGEPDPGLPAGGRDADGEPVDVAGTFAALGHRYGPAFRGAGRAVRRPDRSVLARIELPAEAGPDPRYRLHPALLDACLQVLAPAAAALHEEELGADRVHLPAALGVVRVFGDPGLGRWCRARVRSVDGAAGLVGSVSLFTEDGTEVMRASEVLLRPVDPTALEVPLAELLFDLEWRDIGPVSEQSSSGDPERRWLVCGRDNLAGALTERLADPADRSGSGQALPVRFVDPDQLIRALADPAPGQASGTVQVVLVLPDRDGPDPGDGAVERTVLDIARIARAVDESGRPARLWLLDRDATTRPASGALHGIVRVLRIEQPLLRATLIDLDPDRPVIDQASEVVTELVADGPDDELRLRNGHRQARRLRRVPLPTGMRPEPVRMRPGAYVISGGLGQLGRRMAGWLLGVGATRVVLAGRRADGPGVQEVLDELRALPGARDAEIVAMGADVADPEDVDRLIAGATRDGVPLRGVVHAAGVLHDQPVSRLDADALAEVWAPKVRGGWNLHRATLDADLDLWLVFSSAAGMLGSPGQASYASANAWLDALVAHRRARGLPGTTIAWGAWEGTAAERMNNTLLDPISVDQGMSALELVLSQDREFSGVVRLETERLMSVMPELAEQAFFAEVVPTGPRDEPVDDWPGPRALDGLEPRAARAVVLERLLHRVSGITGHRVAELDPQAPLASLGMDSLMAVRAKNAAEHDFGVTVPVRLLLQGGSLAGLADQLSVELGFPDPSGDGAQPVPAVVTSPREEAAEPSGPVTGTDGPCPATGPVGPRDATERWLASVWSSTSGVTDIDMTSPLAPAGPATAAVAAHILDRFGGAVDPALVLAEPTVERQADVLRPFLDVAVDGDVRVLRDPPGPGTPERAPMFLFHPAGGTTAVYQPLLSLLPADRAVYGMERVESVRTVEEKADRYLERIREIAPRGPYVLGGWSLGGLLAYEVARRLTAEGSTVEALVLIDTVLPRVVPGVTEEQVLRDRFERFLEYLRTTYDVDPDLDLDHLMTLDEDVQMEILTERVGLQLHALGPALLEHQRSSYVDARVAERYRPRSYDGDVVLYRATDRGLTTSLDPRYARDDDALGWDLLCPRLETVPVPGDHTSMIDRPHVEVIGSHLESLLTGGSPTGPRSPEAER